ncbi:MAG: oxaloacetate decarboxylase [Syntrophobacteraceae bacterium]
MQAKKLRQLISQPGLIVAPGAYDAWSARLIEKAGFPVVYMTGYGVSASAIGQPDIGLLTMTEMVNVARNMVNAINIPLIADGDTGYGGILNVIRTVREYEQAGIAAIQLEDQVYPKRCGHMEGKQLVPVEEMITKLRAAVHARKSPDFIIIARTDARAVTGLQDAIARANAYAEVGADVIFLEAPESVDEMKVIAASIDRPLLANMVESGKTPFIDSNALLEIGYKIIIYPVSSLYTVTKAVARTLQKLKNEGTTRNCMDDMVEFKEFNEMIGVQEQRDLEKTFSSMP